MCYSFKTSIVSYMLGMISGIFAILTNQMVLGILILTYSQMQFAEMVIWYGIDTNDKNINQFGTSYGKYLLATHNIAIGLGILLYIHCVKKEKLEIKDFIPMIVGILFFIYIYVFYYLPNDYEHLTYPLDKSCVDVDRCQNPNNRLKWPWPHDWYIYSFIISLILMIIYVRPINSTIWLGFVFTSTFVYMLESNIKVVGSMWCFSTAILAPILVIVNYFLLKKTKNPQNILT